MVIAPSSSPSLHDVTITDKQKLDWEGHRAQVERLYITEGKTLKEVMEIMESIGFAASSKQYKTKFAQWGLHKYDKRCRLPNCNKVSDTDDTESSKATEMEGFTANDKYTSSTDVMYPPDGAMRSYVEAQLPNPEAPQAMTPWSVQADTSLQTYAIDSRLSIRGPFLMTAESQMESRSQNPTVSVQALLRHCEDGLRHVILQPEDIIEIEQVANFFTVVGSNQDGFTPAHALLPYVAAAAPMSDAAAILSRTAVTVIRNALRLYPGKDIESLLAVDMHPSTSQELRTDEYWCLLSSFFSLVLHDCSGDLKGSLDICYAAARRFKRASVAAEGFDWRYLILITNCFYLARRRGKQYKEFISWGEFYLPRRSERLTSYLGECLECLIMWCITALDDVGSWEAFGSFQPDLWTNTAKASGPDISEMEFKTLFCYYWSCFQYRSQASSYSECHIALLNALMGLQRYFHTTALAALSIISRITLCCGSELHLERTRSNLVSRALVRMQRIRNSEPPLGILESTEWEGSRLSATFLETLASQYCRPYIITSQEYRQRVDAAVRDFAERHFELKFSPQAFVHNPSTAPGSIPLSEGRTISKLTDLIQERKSLG